MVNEYETVIPDIHGSTFSRVTHIGSISSLVIIVVEVEGGTWAKGRHTRGKGFENDCRKYNSAALLGYRVLRFTTNMVNSGEALKVIKEVLQSL